MLEDFTIVITERERENICLRKIVANVYKSKSVRERKREMQRLHV